jgi:hypothetical protein
MLSVTFWIINYKAQTYLFFCTPFGVLNSVFGLFCPVVALSWWVYLHEVTSSWTFTFYFLTELLVSWSRPNNEVSILNGMFYISLPVGYVTGLNQYIYVLYFILAGSTQPREYNWGATWKKSSGSGLESREYGCRDSSGLTRGTLYPQKLALISPSSGGHLVGVVRSWTQAMEFYFDIYNKELKPCL